MAKNKKAKIDWQVPANYKDLLTPEEYKIILETCLNILKQKGKIIKVEDGTIFYMPSQVKDGKGEAQVFLDNLIKKCKNAELAEWEEVIRNHFAAININIAAYTYIYKDFEFAEKLLRVLVKSKGIGIMNPRDFITQEHLEGTYSFLVLDFEQKFTYIRREDIKEWGISEEELFRIAIQNTSQEEAEITLQSLDKNIYFYTVNSSDFASSYILNLSQNIPIAVGYFGSIVNIPTKGIAFVYPIEDLSVRDYVRQILPVVLGFHDENPYPITDNFYWYFEGNFYVFPYILRSGYKALSMPSDLIAMLEQGREDG